MVILCLKLKKSSENAKKIRRLNKEQIKQQLIDSIINSDIIEREELNKKAGKVEKSKDAATITKQYEEIIRTKKKKLKLIDKYPKLMMSSVTLGFLKNYYKDIKEIENPNENPNEFE